MTADKDPTELITWKGGTLEAPLPPVLVSCGTMDAPNVLTVAWTGIVNTDPPMTYISVRPERFSFSIPVSYTHLDVYKRQVPGSVSTFCLLIRIYSTFPSACK